ncbi:MAG TPA: glycosyltransferase family 1 protein [Candidatus Binatia bacterium]|nr:glycosyltransferase family 1 protein [Candidatus Binatia bacterium]
MKIAFDLRRIGNPGIGRYMKCLTESIVAQAPEHEYLLILPPQSEHLVHAPNAQKLCTSLKYYSVREQFELPQILSRHKVDLFHSPHFLLPLIRPCPAVATIHDVIYMACREDLPSLAGRLYYRSMMTACSRMATRIMTDSEHSKAEIIHYLKTDPSKIEVVYPAVDPLFRAGVDPTEVASVRSRFGMDRDYLLCVGIYKPRKNHVGLLKAFQLLLKSGVQSQLVIAGPLAEGESVLRRLAQDLGIAQRVVFSGFVSDAELRALYWGARVCVCPSLYEGFGFTVLEAMACGTPVVCSSATSLPEVAGRAALYSDPHKPEEMASQLLRAFSDDSIRASLISDGRANLLRFSWEETARQALEVYHQALQSPLSKAAYA